MRWIQVPEEEYEEFLVSMPGCIGSSESEIPNVMFFWIPWAKELRIQPEPGVPWSIYEEIMELLSEVLKKPYDEPTRMKMRRITAQYLTEQVHEGFLLRVGGRWRHTLRRWPQGGGLE